MAAPTSAEYRAQIGRSIEVVSRVEIFDRSNAKLATTEVLTGEPTLAVTDANLTVDSTRPIRSQGSVTFVVDDQTHPKLRALVPTTTTSPLSPASGTRIVISAGYRLPSGAVELNPMATLYPDDPTVRRVANGIEVTVPGQDAFMRVDRADLTEAITFTAGTATKDVIVYLLRLNAALAANVDIVVDPCAYLTPTIVMDEESKRLTEILDLAASVGFEVFMDRTNRCRMRIRPSTDAPPAWTYRPGDLTPLEGLDSVFLGSELCNGVKVRSENPNDSNAPFAAVVWDTDPVSPTYYDPANPNASVVGPRPFFYRTDKIASQDQANWAALIMFLQKRGLLQRITGTIHANPAIECGDVAEFDDPDIGVTGRYMIEAYAWSMSSPGQMKISCQERRLPVV